MVRTLNEVKGITAMKLDFSPLMMKIARDFEMSPGEVHKALEQVAPGGVSRRAVGYWFADPSDASSRRCDPHWISLLLLSLQMNRKLKRSQVADYLKVMRSMVDFVSFGPESDPKAARQALPSDELALLQKVLDRSERGRSARGHEPLEGNPLPFDPRDARSSVPGI